MNPSTDVLYFEGQAIQKPGPSLRHLLRMASESPRLQQFLDKAIDTLRLNTSRLRADERHLVPAFRSAVDLIERCDEQDSAGVVLSTLAVCLVELGDYI